MKRSGKVSEGAWAVGRAADGTASVFGLTPANMGNEASIFCFLGLTGKAAHFELRVKMDRAAIGLGAKFRIVAQRRNRLEYLDQWLGRLQAARIKFDDFRRFSRVAGATACGYSGDGLWLNFGVAPLEENFPMIRRNPARGVSETLVPKHIKQRTGFKRRDQQEILGRRETRDRRHYFRERLTPGANVFANVNSDK
jgi:hypothetical protein